MIVIFYRTLHYGIIAMLVDSLNVRVVPLCLVKIYNFFHSTAIQGPYFNTFGPTTRYSVGTTFSVTYLVYEFGTFYLITQKKFS